MSLRTRAARRMPARCITLPRLKGGTTRPKSSSRASDGIDVLDVLTRHRLKSPDNVTRFAPRPLVATPSRKNLLITNEASLGPPRGIARHTVSRHAKHATRSRLTFAFAGLDGLTSFRIWRNVFMNRAWLTPFSVPLEFSRLPEANSSLHQLANNVYHVAMRPESLCKPIKT